MTQRFLPANFVIRYSARLSRSTLSSRLKGSSQTVVRIFQVLLKVLNQLNQIRNNQVGGKLFATGVTGPQTQRSLIPGEQSRLKSDGLSGINIIEHVISEV